MRETGNFASVQAMIKEKISGKPKKVATTLAAGLLVAGCAEDVRSGEVTEKVYEHERWYTVLIPMGKGGLMPVTQYDDEDYILKLKNCQIKDRDGECRTGSIYVEPNVYKSTKVGDFVDFSEKNKS